MEVIICELNYYLEKSIFELNSNDIEQNYFYFPNDRKLLNYEESFNQKYFEELGDCYYSNNQPFFYITLRDSVGYENYNNKKTYDICWVYNQGECPMEMINIEKIFLDFKDRLFADLEENNKKGYTQTGHVRTKATLIFKAWGTVDEYLVEYIKEFDLNSYLGDENMKLSHNSLL